ncbi:MAG TPA: hypothetical protein VN726_15075 [Hanamia sp.]|nr:hypothetical protein [Hanamia sp.]
MNEEHGLSIWFFVGGMLTIYGVIIFISNIIAFASPIEGPHVVLERLHAGLWWGILLALLGALFLFLHWPGKHSVLDEKDHDILSDRKN